MTRIHSFRECLNFFTVAYLALSCSRATAKDNAGIFGTPSVVMLRAEATSSGMNLDIGEISNDVKITPEYSDAVLIALLPYFSDVSRRLGLPTSHPITLADVDKFNVLPFRQIRASLRLKNGCVFSFADGFVDTYTQARARRRIPVRLRMKLFRPPET
jgi:hypothetical protein